MAKECIRCGEVNKDDAEKCSQCNATLIREDRPENISSVMVFTIACPECNKQYYLCDETGKIPECTFCKDKSEEIDICNIKPEKKYLMDEYLELFDVKFRKKFIVTICGGLIGRQGNLYPDYFAKNEYISGLHCNISFKDEVWKIEHLSRTNETKLNGQSLANNVSIKLNNKDSIHMADLLFKVKIEKPTFEERDIRENLIPSKELHEKWVIKCPVCHKKYEVEGEESHIQFCTSDVCKDDEYDKVQIASIRPTKILSED